MPFDEPFPLNRFPAQVRAAILSEFNGRCPSQQEVAETPDARWLSTPAIGPAVLKKIRASEQAGAPTLRQMTDAELVRRLMHLQREVDMIHRTVRIKLSRNATRRSLTSEASLAGVPDGRLGFHSAATEPA